MQALLEPCCASLACTKRAALLHRLQDGVFEPLLEGGQDDALAELDTQRLATCLFDLGVHCCRHALPAHCMASRPHWCSQSDSMADHEACSGLKALRKGAVGQESAGSAP